MKKILLMCAAAMIAFAACEKTPDGGKTDGEVCEECGKNPCECPDGSETELFLAYDVKLQHEITTTYGGAVVSVEGQKVYDFFGMTEEEFYLAMGSLEEGAQVNNTLLFGLCYQEDGEWVYEFTPSTTNNFGHYMTRDGLMTTWASEAADAFMYTESTCWWGYESLEAAIADGMEGNVLDFSFGIRPDYYDGQVGNKYTATEFIFDSATQKTCYLTWNLEIVDFIDEEADKYNGAASSKELNVDVTVGTPYALDAMQEAFQLSKYEFAQALAAGQIATTNYIDGKQVEPSAGGFGGVWFDADGNRTLWGSTGEDNPETADVDESVNKPSIYYVELVSTALDLSAYSGYFSEDAKAAMAGHAAINTFKQVVTYTPAEGESYTCTLNYTVKF